MSEQLPHDRLKHGVSNKVHQVHLSLSAVVQQAGVELLREDGAHLCEVGGYQATLDGVVDGTVVLEEGQGRKASCRRQRGGQKDHTE